MEKSASAFVSQASPVLFLGEGCLKWKEQGWQRLWGRPGWLHWRPFAPSIIYLWPIAPRLSPGRQPLNGAMAARTIDLADIPAVAYIDIPRKELGCLLLGFPSQGKVKREKMYLHISSFLFSSSLIPKTWCLTRAQGQKDGGTGWRTRSVHRGSSLCVDHEEDWLKGGWAGWIQTKGCMR